MINRRNKVRLIQILLLILGVIIVFSTYFKSTAPKNKIISSIEKEKLQDISEQSDKSDIFLNIKYSGLDLSGNRYVLTSKEAIVDKNFKEIVQMKFVNAIFYFKDDTTLTILSDQGIYNNKTLDMIFEKKVEANYLGSKIFGEKVVYLNSEKTLEISDNVIIEDLRGTMSADKLLFDLEAKKVDISSNDNKINTNLNIK